MSVLRLVKHQGLGNDFLVALDGFDDVDDGWATIRSEDELADLARRVCARRRGIGADGLLIGRRVGGRTTMVLYNADGSRAEMSGNGIRCFAHAIARRTGSLADQVIETDAGARTVTLEVTDHPDELLATVDMGAVTNLPEPDGWYLLGASPDRPVAHLSLGNPHSVVPVEDVGAVDLVALGTRVPHVNLEIIESGPEPHAVTMRVHERGAGITEACGTGACAAAVAADLWGLATPVDGKLMVHMDGGTATVGIDGPSVTLQGTTTYVGTVEIPVPEAVPPNP
jgi:diaminopimelate epimerase